MVQPQTVQLLGNSQTGVHLLPLCAFVYVFHRCGANVLLNVLPLHRTHIFRLSGLRHEGGAVVCSRPIGHMIIVDPPTWTCDIKANHL